MPSLVIPNAVKVAVEGHDLTSDIPIVVTLGVGCATPASSTDVTAIATAVKNAFASNLTWLSSDWVIDQVVATALDSPTAPQAIVPAGVTGTGGAGYPNMSGVIEFHTLLRGRSYRGKCYIPIPQTSTVIGTGTAAGSWLTGVTGWINTMDTVLNGLANASALVVLSRKLGSGKTVTTIVGRAILGFIRRRLTA